MAENNIILPLMYKEAYEGGEGTIIEKKSRFIATVRPVRSEEEASAFIDEIKKKYWDARHNCHAFICGLNNELTRCSDDGEPPGTAGKPMLDVLIGSGIHNAAVVVTRYFGGVLLGTGGLVRAYTRSVQEGLANAVIIDKYLSKEFFVTCDYQQAGKIQYIISELDIPMISTEYTEKVVFELMVPEEKKDMFVKKITEGTKAKAEIREGDPCYGAVIDRKAVKFDI